MTPDTTLADKVMDNVGYLLANLKDRWSDEKEYEDFNSYIDLVKTKVEEVPDIRFLSMKKTFAFQWIGGDGFRRETSIKRGALQTVRFN